MSKTTGENLLIIVIVSGLFVPLFAYVNHLIRSHENGIYLFELSTGELFGFLALIFVPLYILRLLIQD